MFRRLELLLRPDDLRREQQLQEHAEREYKQQQNEFFKSLLTERTRLIESKTDQAKSYDQAILTFSAGAIALSLTFVEKIAPTPVTPSLLYISWMAFGQ